MSNSENKKPYDPVNGADYEPLDKDFTPWDGDIPFRVVAEARVWVSVDPVKVDEEGNKHYKFASGLHLPDSTRSDMSMMVDVITGLDRITDNLKREMVMFAMPDILGGMLPMMPEEMQEELAPKLKELKEKAKQVIEKRKQEESGQPSRAEIEAALQAMSKQIEG